MFQKAVKAESKLRLAMAGPSGSGKTYTALNIAQHLTDKPVALVDTEHGSASKYADLFSFDVLQLDPPYHPDRFIEAIHEATKAGYGVIILDSLSHAWMGTGGLLDLVDEIAKKNRNPNAFAAWKDATPIQNRLVDGIIASDIHIIATMRSKQEYILQENDKGRQVPKKVGLAPVQRDSFEYEFDIFLEMDNDNNAHIGKTRCATLQGKVISKPGKPLAETLKDWLSGVIIEKRKPITRDEQNRVTEQPAPKQPNGNGNTPFRGNVVEQWVIEGFFDDRAAAASVFNRTPFTKGSHTLEVINAFGKLYRAWKDSGLETDPAIEKALAGEVPAA